MKVNLIMKIGDQSELPEIQKNYDEMAFRGCKNAEFCLATLGNDAGIYGAAKLVL